MPQLILSSLYSRLSWYSFPHALKRSKTNGKPFLMSACFTQQLAHTQPSAPGHSGCSAHTHILWSRGRSSQLWHSASLPLLLSCIVSPKPWSFSCGQRRADHWSPCLGSRDARGSILGPFGLHTKLSSRVNEGASLTQVF